MRLAPSLAAAAILLLAGCAQVTPVPPEPTGDELDRLIALELDFQWQYVGLTPDAPRPTVERIRLVSPAEAEEVHQECMADAGYEANRTSTTFGADNAERLAIYICSAQYPTPPSSFGLFSEEQLGFLYDYLTEVTVPCLEANGVEVPEIPTREQFLVPSTQLKQVWIPYYTLKVDDDLGVLMGSRCRYIPEGFPPF